MLGPLREMFPFKHWKEGEGQFLGKYLKQEADGGIVITQTEYAQQMQGLEISRERRRAKDAEVTEDERRQMRGSSEDSIGL